MSSYISIDKAQCLARNCVHHIMLCSFFIFAFERFSVSLALSRRVPTDLHRVDLHSLLFCLLIRRFSPVSSAFFFSVTCSSRGCVRRHRSSHSFSPQSICTPLRNRCHYLLRWTFIMSLACTFTELSASTTVALINMLKRRDFGSTTDTSPC